VDFIRTKVAFTRDLGLINFQVDKKRPSVTSLNSDYRTGIFSPKNLARMTEWMSWVTACLRGNEITETVTTALRGVADTRCCQQCCRNGRVISLLAVNVSNDRSDERSEAGCRFLVISPLTISFTSGVFKGHASHSTFSDNKKLFVKVDTQIRQQNAPNCTLNLKNSAHNTPDSIHNGLWPRPAVKR